MSKTAKSVWPTNDFTKFRVDYWDGTWEVLTEKEITVNPVKVFMVPPLDELENGPWPTFVRQAKEDKRLRTAKAQGAAEARARIAMGLILLREDIPHAFNSLEEVYGAQKIIQKVFDLLNEAPEKTDAAITL